MNPLPPYALLLRLRVDDADDECRLVMPFHEDVVGRPGYLHGGAIAGLLEFAAFITLARAIGDPAVVMKPITVTVDYMRGGTPRDTFATAEIQRLGSRIANVEAVAWQTERAKPIAAARLNFLLERPRGKATAR
ncbi:MAG: PaaI family thioesterase [Sphingomicrobium sp.]